LLKHPNHSKSPEKANEKRTLVKSPDYIN